MIKYVDRIIEKEVVKEVEVFKEVEVEKPIPFERIREVYVDRPQQVMQEVPVEVPVEIIKEIPVEVVKEVVKEVPVERPIEHERERPRERERERERERPPRRDPRRKFVGPSAEKVRIAGGYKVWDSEYGEPNVGLFRGYLPRGGSRSASRIGSTSDDRFSPVDYRN